MTTIYRGLMNAASRTPTNPAARLRAFQQRVQNRQAPVLNRPPGLPPAPGQGTTQNPGGIIPPHMQQPRPAQGSVGQVVTAPPQPRPAPAPVPPQTNPARFNTPVALSDEGMPSTPAGMPSAPGSINPRPGGVMVPDAASAPRMMSAFPRS